MAKILVYMSPTRGSIYPLVPALESLAQNHQIDVVAPSCVRRMLWERGISTLPMADDVECSACNDFEAATYFDSLSQALVGKMERAKLEITDIEMWVKKVQPDLVLIDGNLLGASAWLEGYGLPWIAWATRLLPFAANGVPQFGLGLPRKRGAISALKNWGKSGSVQKVYDQHINTYNDIRTSNGAPALSSFQEWPTSFKHLIYFTSEPFEYQRTWPSQVHLVGPGNWEPFPETIKLENDERPVVLVSACCEYQDERKLISTVLNTLDPSQLQIAITTAAIDPQLFEVPKGVHIARFSSHNAILKRALCTICPGNLGLVQRSLSYGVPVLAVTYYRDQLEVGQRLKECKAGTALPSSQLTAQNLADNLSKAIACESGARDMQSVFTELDSSIAVQNIVQGVLADG